MRGSSIYQVLENGVPIYKGSRDTILIDYALDIPYFYYVVKKKKTLLGKYQIVRCGDAPKMEKKKEPKKVLTKEERVLEYLLWHLKYMGITNLSENPEKYMDALKQNGLDNVTYRKYYDDDGLDYILEWKDYGKVV